MVGECPRDVPFGPEGLAVVEYRVEQVLQLAVAVVALHLEQEMLVVPPAMAAVAACAEDASGQEEKVAPYRHIRYGISSKIDGSSCASLLWCKKISNKTSMC
jgi:hypothetical protein